MIFEGLGPKGLDYRPCRYGTSKLTFRGPKREFDDPYICFLGGIETYGKFITCPFPEQVQIVSGMTCVNFGLPNAGIDAFSHDPMFGEVMTGAKANVIQILGAGNMTNRYYTVHPRRNDRFISATAMLRNIYPEVDFAEFHFTKHMLSRLLAISPERFDLIRSELQDAWLARMQLLLGQVRGQTILLWFAQDAPIEQDLPTAEIGLGRDPLFITRAMVEKITKNAEAYVEVVTSKTANKVGTNGMVFNQLERLAAAEMLSPEAHLMAAEALMSPIKALL